MNINGLFEQHVDTVNIFRLSVIRLGVNEKKTIGIYAARVLIQKVKLMIK